MKVRLMKPGPATSSSAHAGESAGGHDRLRHVARVAAELLRERQRTVGLGVGPIAGSHHRIDPGSTRDTFERRCEQGSDGDEGIGHEGRIVPVQPLRWPAPFR